MKVSVIIPVYNAKKTIHKCIESLIDQSINSDQYEVIFVDDGSTDGTDLILQDYISKIKLPKLKYLSQKNSGPAKARNLGVKNSESEIVLLTDSDCEVESNWVESMLDVFNDEKVAACKGKYRTKQTEEVAKLVQAEFESKYDVLDKHKYIDFVDTYSAGYKREVFNDFGGFDETYPVACSEDIDLSFRMFEKGFQMAFTRDAIVYHIHPNSFKDIFKKKAKFAYWRAYTSLKLQKISDKRTDFSVKHQLINIGLIPFSILYFLYTGSPFLLVFLLLTHPIFSMVLLKYYLRETALGKFNAFFYFYWYTFIRSSGQFYGLVNFTIDRVKKKQF